MDKKDLNIVKSLSSNSGLAYDKIGKKLGFTESGIRRINKMLKNNEISFSLRLNPEKAGINVCILGIDVEPEYYIKVLEKLKKDEDIIYLYSSTGDHMIIAEIWGNTLEVINKIEKIKGIKKICPPFIIKMIK